MKLKGRVVSGFLWTSVEKLGSMFVLFCAQIILARLLAPEYFGLVAMLTVFLTIGTSFVDSGFSQALIQKQNTKRIDYNSVFYLNIAISLFLYLLMLALSYPIARFYNAPELTKLAPILFLVLPANALSLTQMTIMTKKMDFKTISKTNLVAALSASFVSVTLALLGFGVWALVANLLVLHITKVIMLWIQSSWRPNREFSAGSIQGLFRLGSRLFATGLLTNTFNNLAQLIIGKLYNPVQLGLYSQSLKYKDFTAQAIALPVQNVTFPAFSSLQNENEKLKLSSRKVISILSFALFPAVIGLVLIAEEAFLIAFRDNWLPAVPYFKVLCLSALFMPLSNISLNVMKAKGRGNLILTLEIVKKLFALIVILYAATISVTAITWAYFAWMGFEMLLNLIFIRRVIDYRFKEQLADTLPYLMITLAMWAVITAVVAVIGDLSPLPLMLLKIAVGAIVYTGLSWLLKPAAWKETIGILRELKTKFFPKR